MPRPDPSEPLSVTNNAINLLKVRNISLVNKITALRRKISDISTNKNEYEKKNVALETNFSLFKQHWAKHLEELKALRHLQKPFNDQKLQQEFEECFGVSQTAVESMEFQQSQEEFEEKIIQMFSVLSKIHKDLITNSQKTVESTIEKLNQEIEQKQISSENAVEHLSSFQQKLQELSKSIETINQTNKKIEENPYLVEVQEMKKKVDKLEEELADVREYNETLVRRFKISLRGFLEVDEDLEKEIELGCICGGRVFDYLTIENVKVSREVEEDEFNEERKQNEDSAATNKGIALLNQKLARLEKDVEEITQEKLSLLNQSEKFKLEKKNLDEVFFNSKIYNSLLTQAQELLKYINLLKSKALQYDKLLKDFEKSRTAELEEIFRKLFEDKDKYINMIKDLSVSYDNEKKKFGQIEADLIKEYELSVRFNSILQTMEQNDEKYSTLNQENGLLRTQVKEYNDNLQSANAQVTQLTDKVMKLSLENQRLRALIPGEYKVDEIAYRHSKHREFLNELHNLNKKHNLNIKEKIDDLKIYIKSREEKVEHMEAKVKQFTNEVSQGKKQADQLIKEVEINSRIADDFDQKYKQLSGQIKSQNENFANLVKERVNDKSQFEQEKAVLQGKIKADGELIEKLQVYVNELNAKLQVLTETRDLSEELMNTQKAAIEENKAARESLLKKIEEQKIEITTQKESYEHLEQANRDFMKENENLKKSVKEKSGFITQKLQRLKKMSNDGTIADEEESEFLKLENEKFRKMVNCSVCGLKEKSVVLAKCFHTFCRPCITGTMEARNRRCPVCKTKIGMDDIKPLHWDV